MEEDYTLTKKYHNFLIYLFSSFSSQHNNIIKIIITINSEHFLNLKKFHNLAQNQNFRNNRKC